MYEALLVEQKADNKLPLCTALADSDLEELGPRRFSRSECSISFPRISCTD